MSLMFGDRYDDVEDDSFDGIMSTSFRNRMDEEAEMPLRRQRQKRKPVVRRMRREKE